MLFALRSESAYFIYIGIKKSILVHPFYLHISEFHKIFATASTEAKKSLRFL